MQPMGDFVDEHPGFISMENGFLGQDLHQALLERFQSLELRFSGVLDGRFADRVAKELDAHLANSPTGTLLGVVKITEQGQEAPPILNGGFDLRREGRGLARVAAGTFFDLGPVLRALQLQSRQIKDLTAFKILGRLSGKIFPTGTLLQGMDLDLFGLLAKLQRPAGMTALATGFASRFSAQALGLGWILGLWRTIALTPIRGRRPGTVLTVLGQQILQALQFFLQSDDPQEQSAQVLLGPSQQLLKVLHDTTAAGPWDEEGKGKRP